MLCHADLDVYTEILSISTGQGNIQIENKAQIGNDTVLLPTCAIIIRFHKQMNILGGTNALKMWNKSVAK